ncbi:MAG: hypothetical protein HKO04_14290 [Silicimonas sp.]|nr:hypothetical protein [Silicimonas sp.]
MIDDKGSDGDTQPVHKGLIDGPIDYGFLKREIQDKGPVRKFHPDTGLELILNITPCQCGFEGCTEDVISLAISHGVASFRSIVEKDDLMRHDSVDSFFHDFFHYPEAYFGSSGDEQMIEAEVISRLGVNPFAVYSSEDMHSEINKQISQVEVQEFGFWETHNLLPLLRILGIKRRLRKDMTTNAEKLESSEAKQLIEDVFDIGFLAGRLWSEYRTKVYHEDEIEKGLASLRAQAKRTAASGRKSAEKKKTNLECFLLEIEALSDHFPAFPERAILNQAYKNASRQREMPRSQKTIEEYETELRSNPEYRERYNAVFRTA